MVTLPRRYTVTSLQLRAHLYSPCNFFNDPTIQHGKGQRSISQPRFFSRAKTMRLPQKEGMNITKNLGMLLLAIYLILVGIMALVHLAIPVIVTGILALAAGILILIGK
jgi:hypothetical protein